MAIPDDRYLFKNHRTYVLKLAVPRDLRDAEGRSMIVLSLKTGEIREARARRDIELGRIRERWARVRSETSDSPETLTWLTNRLADLRVARQRQQVDHEQADFESGELLEMFLARQPKDEAGPVVSEEDVETIRSAIAAVADPHQITLAEAAKVYLDEAKDRVRPQTHKEMEQRLQLLMDHFGKTRSPSSITRLDASKLLTDVIQPRAWAIKTKREVLGALSTFYSWAEVRGMATGNPFHRLSGSLKESRRGVARKERPWTGDELLTLVTHEAFKPDLRSLAAIALYTGLRREEVCTLRKEQVHDGLLVVHEGKTKAAPRQVPLHWAVLPLVTRLVDETPDGFLLPALKPGGPNRLRGHSIGKRFHTAQNTAGIAGVRLHDLRRNFAQALETADVPENVAKQLIGHHRESMTYGLYSPGVRLPELRAAVGKVTFGDAVDSVVARL